MKVSDDVAIFIGLGAMSVASLAVGGAFFVVLIESFHSRREKLELQQRIDAEEIKTASMPGNPREDRL